MPFMLQSCGHALRFMTADGICRRCSMDVNGVLAGQESESPSETMVLDKASSPTAVEAASSKPEENTLVDPDAFCRQVEKLVGVLINSDGTEISDAVQHVARAMSTFTAVERADFISHLIIMYCEARREDQPKIILLIKELSKKNVLARTHFLQSAKKIIADIPQLTVDWPNIYDCSTFLVYTCLEIIDKSTESLRSFETILARAPPPHGSKFLDGFHRFCHLPPEGSALSSSPRKSITADTLHNPRQTLPFFRSPEAARDRLMRPLSQIDLEKSRQRVMYSRERLLEIEQAVKGRPVPSGLVERLVVVMGEGKKEEREGMGKRPRYVSESAVGSDMGSKRLLESTSPVLAGEGLTHGRPHFEKFAPTPRQIILPPRNETADQHHPSHSPVKHPRDYFHHPVRQDFQRGGPTNENLRPNFHPHPPGPQFVRPHFRSSASVSEGAGDMGQLGYRRQTMGGVKTKKFLTALSIERDSDAGPESPPVTLAPGERTWARGSGSLKPLSQQQRKNTDENWRRAAP